MFPGERGCVVEGQTLCNRTPDILSSLSLFLPGRLWQGSSWAKTRTYSHSNCLLFMMAIRICYNIWKQKGETFLISYGYGPVSQRQFLFTFAYQVIILFLKKCKICFDSNAKQSSQFHIQWQDDHKNQTTRITAQIFICLNNPVKDYDDNIRQVVLLISCSTCCCQTCDKHVT